MRPSDAKTIKFSIVFVQVGQIWKQYSEASAVEAFGMKTKLLEQNKISVPNLFGLVICR